MLLEELQNALKRGARIRILTGNYLGITQPSALYLLKRKLNDQVDLRFYNEKDRSFHAKSYFFHYQDYSELYIGSSNISRSALTSRIEWNYRFNSKMDPENYRQFFQTFEDLFEHHSIVVDDDELRRYSKEWHRPAVVKDLDHYEEAEWEEPVYAKDYYQPRGAQIEALCALDDTRAEGACKALVSAATGDGGMPFNMGKNYFKITDFVGNIGEATGDWRRNQKLYERIQGIVLDTRYLMYHYSGKPLKEKVALAECIEAVLGKPLIPAGSEALPEHKPVKYEFSSPPVMMVAEDPAPYGVKKEDE